MEKIWMKPQAIAEQFAANEYVASCGDVTTHYEFVCDAESKYGALLTGYSVYYADGTEMGDYKKCGATHAANKNDDFLFDCYMKKNVLGFPTGDAIPVVVWRGEDGDNIHCTTNIDQSTWEETKS